MAAIRLNVVFGYKVIYFSNLLTLPQQGNGNIDVPGYIYVSYLTVVGNVSPAIRGIDIENLSVFYTV